MYRNKVNFLKIKIEITFAVAFNFTIVWIHKTRISIKRLMDKFSFHIWCRLSLNNRRNCSEKDSAMR